MSTGTERQHREAIITKLDQIELERSASSQWETGKGHEWDRSRGLGGREKDGTEEEGIFVAETDGRGSSMVL